MAAVESFSALIETGTPELAVAMIEAGHPDIAADLCPV
jgi:hypothetical protein